MPFYWPSCSLTFCLLLFSLSLLPFYGFVLYCWGLQTDRVLTRSLPALHCQRFLIIIISHCGTKSPSTTTDTFLLKHTFLLLLTLLTNRSIRYKNITLLLYLHSTLTRISLDDTSFHSTTHCSNHLLSNGVTSFIALPPPIALNPANHLTKHNRTLPLNRLKHTYPISVF